MTQAITLTVSVNVKRRDMLRKRVGQAFDRSGSSAHSLHGSTLGLVIEYCERNGIAYVIEAIPGVGYVVRKYGQYGRTLKPVPQLKRVCIFETI